MPSSPSDFHDPTTAALYAASNTGLFPQEKTSIYRFVGLRSEDSWRQLENTVLNSVMPLSIASALNDPFEANPVIVNDTTPADLASFMKRAWAPGGTLSALKFGDELSAITKIDDPRFQTPELQAKLLDKLLSLMVFRNERCHVGSFSRRISSELQWSHYANGYKGIAYHFVTRSSADSGFRYLRSVKYSTQRPIILVSEIMDQMNASFGSDEFTRAWLSFEQRSFLTKSKEWAYEEEERIVRQDESEMRFLASELISIILGPRFPRENLGRLRSIVSKRSRPIRIFAASVSATTYSIEVDWSKEAV
jgi:hypothetical protein